MFAERVLGRSQGTLSGTTFSLLFQLEGYGVLPRFTYLTVLDLLRNPKPWNKLKSGRETFRRMYNWLKMSNERRLVVLELWRPLDENGPNARLIPKKFRAEQQTKMIVDVPPEDVKQQAQRIVNFVSDGSEAG